MLLLIASACTVGPNYKRPAVATPDQFYNAAPVNAGAAAETTSLGDEKWFTVFGDPELQTLIRTALEKSFDVRIAASRILQAQEQVGITRAGEFPSVTAGPAFSSQKLPGHCNHLLSASGAGLVDARFLGPVPARHRSRASD